MGVKNDTALALMQEALAIYDQTGDGTTIIACHLQAAIDEATGAKPLQPGEEIDPELLERF